MASVPGRTFFHSLSNETGFKSDVLEKVHRLLSVIERIGEMATISGKLALKGGTAIQGIHFGFRRLSIDADLNYIGSTEKNVMLEERKEVGRVLGLVSRDMGYTLAMPHQKYALDEFNLHYINNFGGQDRIKVEINYLERLPAAGVSQYYISHPFEDLEKIHILSYKPEELFAGKMRAFLVRRTPRDVFDTSLISSYDREFDQRLFRKLCLFYLTMQEMDVRTMRIEENASVSESEIRDNLVPLLSRKDRVDYRQMNESAFGLGRGILTLQENEKMFFDSLYGEGSIILASLFEDIPYAMGLEKHPALSWRLRQDEAR